jgi:hypothetical protein
LRKRDHSARSLEVVAPTESAKVVSNVINPGDEKWLVEKVERLFLELEQAGAAAEARLDHLYVMVGALKVLGLEGAAQSFVPRLTKLKERQPAE